MFHYWNKLVQERLTLITITLLDISLAHRAFARYKQVITYPCQREKKITNIFLLVKRVDTSSITNLFTKKCFILVYFNSSTCAVFLFWLVPSLLLPLFFQTFFSLVREPRLVLYMKKVASHIVTMMMIVMKVVYGSNS